MGYFGVINSKGQKKSETFVSLLGVPRAGVEPACQ